MRFVHYYTLYELLYTYMQLFPENNKFLYLCSGRLGPAQILECLLNGTLHKKFDLVQLSLVRGEVWE